MSTVLLGACSSDVQRVGATSPTVTYAYGSATELDAAEDGAEEYCDDRCDAEARRLDLWATNGQASFTCVPD